MVFAGTASETTEFADAPPPPFLTATEYCSVSPGWVRLPLDAVWFDTALVVMKHGLFENTMLSRKLPVPLLPDELEIAANWNRVVVCPAGTV